MTIRWGAVFLGLLVDVVLSSIIQAFARQEFFPVPDITNQHDLAILVLSALAIGVGGYVAGRRAGQDRAINGLLVGVVDVIYTTLFGGLMARPVVLMEAVGCVLAGLGGYLSRFPSTAAVQPPTRRD